MLDYYQFKGEYSTIPNLKQTQMSPSDEMFKQQGNMSNKYSYKCLLYYKQ